MKYILNTGLLLFAAISGFGQIMQASIGAGSTPTRVMIYVKPTAAVNGVISTLQFDVAVDASIFPAPSIAIIGVPAFGITWNIDPSYVEGTYRHYQFTTATSPSVVIGSEVETMLVELEFSGGPVSAHDVSLQTFGFDNANGYPGGNSGNIIFYCSGAANSAEGQLYYSRPGTTVINNPSYTGPLPSSATISGILLPLNWLSFNVTKQDDNAILNWMVANEDQNHHYEIQRSSNGSAYTTIATVNKSANGNTAYSYTDAGVSHTGAKILYYRIKQIDVDGSWSYSDIRYILLEKITAGTRVFPNPARDGFYLSIPFATRDNSMVQLNLVGANGQSVSSRQITTAQAANYYYKTSDLSGGNYILQIVHDKKLLDSKKIIIER